MRKSESWRYVMQSGNNEKRKLEKLMSPDELRKQREKDRIRKEREDKKREKMAKKEKWSEEAERERDLKQMKEAQDKNSGKVSESLKIKKLAELEKLKAELEALGEDVSGMPSPGGMQKSYSRGHMAPFPRGPKPRIMIKSRNVSANATRNPHSLLISDYELFRMLLAKKEISINAVRKPDNNTFLHVAIQHALPSITKYLLEKGASTNIMNRDKLLPIHVAAARGDQESLECLIKAGADIEAQSPREGPPLHHAARNGHTDCVVTLLEYGSKINARSPTGRSAVHWAAEEGQIKALKVLLDQGAEVDAREPRSLNSPMMMAAMRGQYDAVLLLCRYGADILLKNVKQETLRDYVRMPDLIRMFTKGYEIPGGMKRPSEDQSMAIHRFNEFEKSDTTFVFEENIDDMDDGDQGSFHGEMESHDTKGRRRHRRSRRRLDDDENMRADDRVKRGETITRVIYCKRKILKKWSPVFGKFLHSRLNISEKLYSANEIYNIHDVSYDDFYELVKFIYTGYCEVNAQNHESLLRLALKHKLHYLTLDVLGFIIAQINMSNVVHYANLGHELSISYLLSCCKLYITIHLTKMLGKGISQLHPDVLKFLELSEALYNTQLDYNAEHDETNIGGLD